MRITIPVGKIAEYSAGTVLVLYVLGFVISVQYFGRAGVSIADFPLTLMVGAGVSFVWITGFFVLLGRQFNAAENVSDLLSIFGLVILMLALIAQFLIFRGGFVSYCLLAFFAGYIGAFSGMTTFSQNGLTVHYPTRFIAALVLVLFAYSALAFPNLSRALGGAAPKPLRLSFTETYRNFFPLDSRVYEVLATESTLYLAVEPTVDVDPKAADDRNIVLPIPRYIPFRPGTRFFQIPRIAVKAVEYTDEWKEAPKIGRE